MWKVLKMEKKCRREQELLSRCSWNASSAVSPLTLRHHTNGSGGIGGVGSGVRQLTNQSRLGFRQLKETGSETERVRLMGNTVLLNKETSFFSH